MNYSSVCNLRQNKHLLEDNLSIFERMKKNDEKNDLTLENFSVIDHIYSYLHIKEKSAF